MKTDSHTKEMTRREFLKGTGSGLLFSALGPIHLLRNEEARFPNDLFWIKDIPHQPFVKRMGQNSHAGIECLLYLMEKQGLMFYRSDKEHDYCGPAGLIGSEDVVLIKVNAQWKYRGCTNSDLVRGLIQSILDHPSGFAGEVIVIENGQGRGSLNCDTHGVNKHPYPDDEVHANADNESHSFVYLVNTIFRDPKVSAYLLDPLMWTFIGKNDHETEGYRIFENISYPCFNSPSGRRIELRQGIWNGRGYDKNLKLINIPVLKHHDIGGSEITASLKNFYGVLSMRDGQAPFRHYKGMGETCGKMICSVRTPVLNILDAIWVSYSSLRGYPEETTFRANQILASQDPVALDTWAAKHIMYPIDLNIRHHSTFPGIDRWLTDARNWINGHGGLYAPDKGIFIDRVTKDEAKMRVHQCDATSYVKELMKDKNYDRRKRRPIHKFI